MKVIKNRITSRLPLAALFLMALFAFTASCAKKGAEEIKIGAILPLTGDGAKYGEEARNGIELALEELNDLRIKVLYEDDQGTAKGAVNAFSKLVESSKVLLIIGPMYSSTALAIAPLGNKNKIVIFSPSASSPELTKAGDYFFRNWPSDVSEGGEMAKFSYNVLELRTVAILSINLDYGVGLTYVFENAYESLGGKILTIEYYDQGTTDFRTQLNKVKALKPQAIYLPGYYAEIGLILRQAREMGINTRFLSCVGFDNPKVLELASTSAEEVIFARPYYDPDSPDLKVKSFVERFIKKYNMYPGIYAAHAYDALKITVNAIKKGGYEADGIATALHSIKNFPGITGTTSFDDNGDVEKPIQIMQVQNGKFEKY